MQRRLWESREEFLDTQEHLTVEYSALIKTPQSEIGRIVEYLDLTPSPEQLKMAETFVDPGRLNSFSNR